MYSKTDYIAAMATQVLDTPAKRLAWAREHIANFRTADAAADALGIPRSTHASRENGNRGLPAKAADLYGKRWKINKNWLLYGEGEPRLVVASNINPRDGRVMTAAGEAESASLVRTDVAVADAGDRGVAGRNDAHDGTLVDLSTAPEQVHRLADALNANRIGTELWQLTSDALEAFGYRQGDYLAVDRKATAMAGQFVLAESHSRGTSAFLFRCFEPPYLISGSSKVEHRRPLLVDNITNMTIGVVFASARL
jgi:hypothetical protein